MVDEVQVFDVSDIFERAVKTALDVFIVALPASLVLNDVPVLADLAGAAGLAAASAFVSVLINAVQQYARSKSSEVKL